jgi:Fe-S cluster biosynthesis and repair protein YggX
MENRSHWYATSRYRQWRTSRTLFIETKKVATMEDRSIQFLLIGYDGEQAGFPFLVGDDGEQENSCHWYTYATSRYRRWTRSRTFFIETKKVATMENRSIQFLSIGYDGEQFVFPFLVGKDGEQENSWYWYITSRHGRWRSGRAIFIETKKVVTMENRSIRFLLIGYDGEQSMIKNWRTLGKFSLECKRLSVGSLYITVNCVLLI